MLLPDNWFKEWFNSPYYHQLYFEHNEAEAAAFVNRIVDHLSPVKGSRMIDIACGRGRHARLLASRGFDVTGIDIAPDSIAYASAFQNDHLHFFEHDMRLPFWINYFDYAFNFFTSFGYFRTERENSNAVRTISQSLKKNGIILLDYLNARFVEEHFVPNAKKEINGVRYFLSKWFDEKYFYKRILIEDENQPAPLEFVEKIAKFSLGDFNDMFAYHGLQMQEVFGDYELKPFDIKNSPRLILLAKKC